MAACSDVAVAILRDGRASKSAVADFDTLRLPKSGKPDFGARPPQDEVRWVPSANFDGVEIRRCTGNSTIPKRCEKCPQIPFGANSMVAIASTPSRMRYQLPKPAR